MVKGTESAQIIITEERLGANRFRIYTSIINSRQQQNSLIAHIFILLVYIKYLKKIEGFGP